MKKQIDFDILSKLSEEISDFHSHILPNLDDGSSNVQESVDMLLASKMQGVQRIVATPHFYPAKESPENFLKRRKASSEKLRSVIKDISKSVPCLCLGAEVAYFSGIYRSEALRYLCISGTNYLLVEMPSARWSENELEGFCGIRDLGLIPILAHVERCLPLQKRSTVERLMGEKIVFQLNSEAFLRFRTSKFALNIVKSYDRSLLGSDCHGLADRVPNLSQGIAEINKKIGSECIDKINKFALSILEHAEFV